MIYNNLDILPVKTFFKVQETGNLNLLVTGNEPISNEELSLVFDRLSDEFQELSSKGGSERNFMLIKEISHLESKYKTAICGIEILRFEVNLAILQSLKELLNIKIRTNTTQYYYKVLS